jgi:hypothetical protein
MIPGTRESRRIKGPHVLIQSEVERAELFPDRVAYGGWPMDDHPPGGFYASDKAPCTQIRLDKPYPIPLRSLYSVNRPNLLMAGRNISASHVAFSSSRVMATCSTMGQAAGAAAAFCVKSNCLPKDIVADSKRMAQFQQQLLRDDQSLIGIRNEDADDLARKAMVACSSATDDGAAAQVIDGWNRDIGDGPTHQWRAEMRNGEPWLQLEWPAPVTLKQIQLTFDSGLHRRLLLSGEDSVYNSQVRGAQPEIAADYTIEARDGNAWKSVAQVRGNFVRLVRHNIEPVTTQALRIRVERTNGDPLARLFEIRCYG